MADRRYVLLQDSLTIVTKQLNLAGRRIDSIAPEKQFDREDILIKEITIMEPENRAFAKSVEITGQLKYPASRDFEIRGLLLKLDSPGNETLVAKGQVKMITEGDVFFDYRILTNQYLSGTKHRLKLLFEGNSISKEVYYN